MLHFEKLLFLSASAATPPSIAGVTDGVFIPRISIGEIFIYDDSDSSELEVEEPAHLSPRITEFLAEDSCECETSSSIPSDSEDSLEELEFTVFYKHNEELFSQFPEASSSRAERLRRQLLFFFDGRQVIQEQFNAFRQIRFWIEDLNLAESDQIFQIAVENEWSYLIAHLLRIFPHPPSASILLSALACGRFHIANLMLDNERAEKEFLRRPVVIRPESFRISAPNAYLNLQLEILTKKLVAMRCLDRDDARLVLRETVPQNSPRALVSLGQAFHRRTRSLFQKEKPKPSLRRVSRSADNSPRANEDI